MKFTALKYLMIVLGLSFTVQSLGQTIPTLKADPAVKNGTLPNGLTWYVATNPSIKGLADFAIVQTHCASTDSLLSREEAVKFSQEALGAQPHLLSSTAQDFFTGLGVIPGENGFVEVEDNATVFRFSNINVLQSSSVVDSTLLVLMDMVGMASRCDDARLKSRFPASSQAIIVAGDVDAGQISEKLKMLSYMVSKDTPAPREKYQWNEQDTAVVNILPGADNGLAQIKATWRLQRTPKEYMNTAQPVVFERFMSELGIVAEKRLRDIFREAGIPVADVSSVYKSGVETLGDESFSVSVSVADDNLSTAVSTLSDVMASLNLNGARISEIKRAANIFSDALVEKDNQKEPKNSDYINRCVSAFIYNAPLTTRKEIRSILQSKRIPDSTRVDLFHSIVSASTDSRRNLILEAATGDTEMTADSLRNIFESSWMMAQEKDYVVDSIIKYPHLEGYSDKMKVRSVKKEYLSGGSVFTMANGLRVIVKPLPLDGVAYYSLALNGGYGSIPDLCPGEGACVADYMKFCTIGGVDSETFVDVVRQKGVLLDMDIDVAKTTVHGRVQSDRIEYFFRALLTLINDSKVDSGRLAYYLDCLPLIDRHSQNGLIDRISVIDSLMCPDYKYTAYSRDGLDGEELKRKIDSFFLQQSQKVNEGVLILAGDIDEKALKDVLQRYAGGFKTSEKPFSRPLVQCQILSGTLTHSAEGRSNVTDIVMSAPMPLTANNYYLASIASMVLKRYLARSVTGKGMHLRLSHRFEKYPQERLGVMVTLNEASIEGFAQGTAHDEPLEALNQVRNLLSDLSVVDISDARLASYKNRLIKRVNLMQSDPEFWIEMLTGRYLDGKDLLTGAEAKIKALTKDDVLKMLVALGKNSRVEYTITRK